MNTASATTARVTGTAADRRVIGSRRARGRGGRETNVGVKSCKNQRFQSFKRVKQYYTVYKMQKILSQNIGYDNTVGRHAIPELVVLERQVESD